MDGEVKQVGILAHDKRYGLGTEDVENRIGNPEEKGLRCIVQ